MSGERILVVEDESILALLIKNKLKNWDYKVVDWVDTGEEAVKKAIETKPDLILMDIVLKGEMDGVEAAKQIHEQLDTPVIYLTAYSDDEILKRARVTEPYGYIFKPFRENEVNANIEIALQRHESEKKQIEQIKKRVLSDFYDLIQTSLNIYTDYSDEEIKKTLLGIFSERLEKDLPTFDDHIRKLGLGYDKDDPQIIFDAYLPWISDLLSSLGINSKIGFNENGYYLEFLNCPWLDESKNNPIFCLNCLAIVKHSLNWAEINSSLEKNKTIAEGSSMCIFKLYD